jgi:prefoldin subunit 5
MKREYNVLLRSARDYQANTSQLKKAINELQKDIDTLNKAKEDSNIFSINKKKK